jgi:choline dehydrogenase
VELGQLVPLLQEGNDARLEHWDECLIITKSVTFTEPRTEVVQEYGYTWDTSVYGGTTPIYSSFPTFLWSDIYVAREAWKDMGIRALDECAGGDKEGLCWIPISQHPITARRSHAGLGHYAAVNNTRPNYDLLVKHQAIRVVYTNGTSSGPPLIGVRSLIDGHVFNVTATAELIISAGALHTPTILQRSGIGPASFLKAAKIPLVLDLPGVGSNLQDHSSPGISWNCESLVLLELGLTDRIADTKPTNFSNMPSNMLDPAYAVKAAADFDAIPARGPYTLALSNIALFISLPKITADYMQIVKKMRNMIDDASLDSYLPADTDATLNAGYKRQLSVLADLLANPEAPSVEVPFATGTSMRPINLHPLSRGTVRLNATHHLALPILDYRAGTNPIDFDINIAHIKWLRKVIDTPTLQKYGAIEVTPGLFIQSDEDLKVYVKESMVLSHMHPCCTAAMMPKSLGGVVGPDLRVHGAAGLRVVDISVLPFLPSSHTSATAYAVGEKVSNVRKNLFADYDALTRTGC